jgi:transcriptional regulator with XRE-family HTH domain
MTTVHSPTAGRRRLRNMLRRARDQAGLTQEQVAAAMDWSLSKVIRIETGAVSISTNDLRQLLQHYRIEDPQRVAELVELARIGRRRPWWTQYKDAFPPEYISYVGLEDECVTIQGYSPTGMPGLLQTEEFANAAANASSLRNIPQQSPKHSPNLAAQIRMTRQRNILRRENPPTITMVLDEAVIRRQVGGPQVLQRQLLHLVQLGAAPHIVIRVLPFTATFVTMMSYFVILDFEDPADPAVVYAEGAFEQHLIEGPQVDRHRQMFERLLEASLSEADSLALIARIAGQL